MLVTKNNKRNKCDSLKVNYQHMIADCNLDSLINSNVSAFNSNKSINYELKYDQVLTITSN